MREDKMVDKNRASFLYRKRGIVGRSLSLYSNVYFSTQL